MQANKIINNHIESYRNQEVAGSNMILQMQQKHILSILSDKKNFYGAEICGLGITYAQKSFHLMENGNSTKEAISFLNLSLMYSEVGLGVKLDSFKKNSTNKIEIHDLKKYFSEYSSLLLWAILMNNINLAIRLKDKLAFCLNQKEILKGFPLDFEYFTLWLFYRWRGIQPDIDLLISGDFWSLVDSWSNPSSQLEDTVSKICDFHCAEVVDKDSRKFPPKFVNPPFTLLPLEIHVINKLRLIDGFEGVSIDHPLMNTNISKIISFEFIEDDLLERVEISLC